MTSASQTPAAATLKLHPGTGAAGPFAIHEAIAVGVLVALVIHGLLVGMGAGGVPALSALWETLPAGRPPPPTRADLPLLAILLIGGAILVAGLLRQVLAGVFGADLLAGVAILTSVLLGEWLAGALVVLMLSGGKALEERAVSRAGSVLAALARRMPTLAHRREAGGIVDVALGDVAVGDVVVVLPHEICPVDGEVVAGRSRAGRSSPRPRGALTGCRPPPEAWSVSSLSRAGPSACSASATAPGRMAPTSSSTSDRLTVSSA